MSHPIDQHKATQWPWDLRLLATAYVVGVAFLHQYVYWSSFAVNILEQATLFDLAKFTVWPLVGALTATPLVFGIINLIDEAVDKKSRVSAVILVLGSIVPIAVSAYQADPLLYLLIASAAASALYAVLISQGIDPFKQYFSRQPARRLILMTLIYLPLVSAASAGWRAELVHQGKKVELAHLPLDVLSAHGVMPDQKLTYLGSTENYAFFWIDGGPTVLRVRTDAMSGFRIKPIGRGEATKR